MRGNQPGKVQTILRVRGERFWVVKEANGRRIEVVFFLLERREEGVKEE